MNERIEVVKSVSGQQPTGERMRVGGRERAWRVNTQLLPSTSFYVYSSIMKKKIWRGWDGMGERYIVHYD